MTEAGSRFALVTQTINVERGRQGSKHYYEYHFLDGHFYRLDVQHNDRKACRLFDGEQHLTFPAILETQADLF